MYLKNSAYHLVGAALLALAGCGNDPAPTDGGPNPGADGGTDSGMTATGFGPAADPATADVVAVDRFSDEAAMLFRRSANAALPAANVAIDFDNEPFITRGLGPAGQSVRYYNFDVQPTTPAPIYVLFEEGADVPVEGQLNIVDVVPGGAGYSDFWRVNRVTVPSGYVANSITSAAEIMNAGLTVTETDMIVNCPVVPAGSTATMRYIGGGPTGTQMGWYQDEVVHYFVFTEAELAADGDGLVPLSPIYVAFADDTGPPFTTETGSDQTHNVVGTLPGSTGYSPLWEVNRYDTASFATVTDLASAQAASPTAVGANVNCPLVSIEFGDAEDPSETAVAVDRFSDAAAMLFRRSANPGLPAANVAVDYDMEPFVTQGLGPAGGVVRYYNFDVQPTVPAPIYVLFEEGADMPVDGQANIIDAIPGDAGYSDFWQVNRVTVPVGYVANTITSLTEITDARLPVEATDMIVNCPVVPDGSTATMRFTTENPAGLVNGWYQGTPVRYFVFTETELTADGDGLVPLSSIYVTFADNTGPPFMTETGTSQTHNVVATLPGQAGYSPLWEVNVYDNTSFASVTNLASAQAASPSAAGANVNCPVVDQE